MQKRDKREAILQAALELIAENGFQHTPMSLIATRAGVSAGIIYHYFTSKEDLIQALYRRVKADLGCAIIVGDLQQVSLREQFLSFWIRMFRYCVAHPHETIFLEQYESSPTWQPHEEPLFDEEVTFFHLLEEYQKQGVLKSLPAVVLNELTLGMALRLAQQFSAGFLSVDDERLPLIATACWDAIAT